jgi:hypothetical protein
MNLRLVLSTLFIILIFNSCDDKYPFVPNKNIHKIGDDFECSAVWGKNDTIYSLSPFKKTKVNADGEIVYDTIYHEEWKVSYFIEISDSCDYLLFIRSIKSGASIGALKEISLKDGSIYELLDSTENISSAHYFRDSKHIIYHSYGNPIGTNSGYFMYDKATGERKLLFEYNSTLDGIEIVNGFDIHPYKDELLIPVTYLDRCPKIITYNLNTHETSVLIDDPKAFPLLTLWLRYNSNGSKILYTSYPIGLLVGIAYGKGETGILELPSLSKRVLNLSIESGQYETFCANWSPDDSRIVFSSAPVDPNENFSGVPTLYVLNKF